MLRDTDRPIRPDQLQHNPPLHPKLPVPCSGLNTTPRFWSVSRLLPRVFDAESWRRRGVGYPGFG
jgi:hypothetical protein